MLLAADYLAQGESMVLLDEFEIVDNCLYSSPKYDGISEYSIIPISLWTESVCQNGEVLHRMCKPEIKEALLTNVSEITYPGLSKKQAREVSFIAKELMQTGHYVKTEIKVMLGNKEIGTSCCTHYIS